MSLRTPRSRDLWFNPVRLPQNPTPPQPPHAFKVGKGSETCRTLGPVKWYTRNTVLPRRLWGKLPRAELHSEFLYICFVTVIDVQASSESKGHRRRVHSVNPRGV